MVKHEHIIKSLLAFKEVMERNKIPYWLDFGTLLGAVREGKLIDWDKDGDVGVWIEDLDKMKALEDEFRQNDICIYYQPSHAFLNLKINDREWIATVDIYTYKKLTRKGRRWVARIENGQVFDVHSPAEYYEWLCLIPFLDTMFSVPCDFIEVLEFLYGPQWSTPIEIQPEAYKLKDNSPDNLQKHGRSGRKKWDDVK